MAEERVQRRLAAILAADVAGYSRLMGVDEAGTRARFNAHLNELIEPAIESRRGRIVKTTGDALLVEFASVVDAVQCAVEIQKGMAERNADEPGDRRMAFRIGVNLGDVIIEGDDIHGDGVNIAARLEGLAEPGGMCISEDVFRQVRGKLDYAFDDLGGRKFKNIAEPIRVYAIDLAGEGGISGVVDPVAQVSRQEIRFCTSSDGVRIAYATAGNGLPLVKAATWLSHLEFDWWSSVWKHLLQEFSRDHRLIRYDERGNGLSDREVEDISFDAFVRDLEAVVDAAGLDRFALLGISQGAAVSVKYSLLHPERVTHLVLHGGHTRGWRKFGTSEQIEQREALQILIRHGWGQENPAFRQLFALRFIPEGTSEQLQWFDDLQRMTTSPEIAARIFGALGDLDDLGPSLAEIAVPTLVLHCRDDAVVPFDEGRILATEIPGARFVALDSPNHLILENEPAWSRFKEEVRGFLADGE